MKQPKTILEMIAERLRKNAEILKEFDSEEAEKTMELLTFFQRREAEIEKDVMLRVWIDGNEITQMDLMGLNKQIQVELVKPPKKSISEMKEAIENGKQETNPNWRKCIIGSCSNPVQPSNEVDIGVGVLTDYTEAICAECYTSENPEIQRQVEEALNKDKDGLPF